MMQILNCGLGYAMTEHEECKQNMLYYESR